MSGSVSALYQQLRRRKLVEAYELYLRARGRLDRMTESSLREAVGLLREALRREPG